MRLDDLKALLPAPESWALERQILDTLTGGLSQIQEAAGVAAARYVYAALIRCGATERDFSADEHEILGQALHLRAIYELYSRSEVEASAEDKREDARVLLRALLGDCAFAATSSSAAPAARVSAAVSQDAPPARPGGAAVLAPWGFWPRVRP